MKIFVVILCLMLGNAMAKTVAIAENQSGGVIVLTDTPCKDKKTYFVYANNAEGKVNNGCWFIDENFIFILWSDGELRSYPFDMWKIKKKGNNV